MTVNGQNGTGGYFAILDPVLASNIETKGLADVQQTRINLNSVFGETPRTVFEGTGRILDGEWDVGLREDLAG